VNGGMLYAVAALVLAVIALGFFLQVERSKRKRSEERVEALSRSVDVAQRTSSVMHEIALEKDKALSELGEAHWETQRQLTEKQKELDDAAPDAEKIAGLFNEHMRERDSG
jgi:septal ring factor EnvC (AmiA/AmiB activator)